MNTVDWAALEADMEAVSRRIPMMGETYRTTRACSAVLGQMGCVKIHTTSRDPVHVAAHRNYGVVAVWSEEGGPPQINCKLARRVGIEWLAYLFGEINILLTEPVEETT